tara:strand:- start:8368 stop:8736 length:369 start_codon:yes stop_codon:yes gene_type:complete
MNFELKKPCKNCPFIKEEHRKENKGWLGKARAKEIFDSMAIHDYSFPCHKTTKPDSEELDMQLSSTSQHCAGALALQEKLGFANQMTRIAGRLGIYNPKELIDTDKIVDSEEEFVELHTRSK